LSTQDAVQRENNDLMFNDFGGDIAGIFGEGSELLIG